MGVQREDIVSGWGFRKWKKRWVGGGGQEEEKNGASGVEGGRGWWGVKKMKGLVVLRTWGRGGV